MELSRSARRVAEALERSGIPGEVQELPDSTRSAGDAATALGCDISQIVKSLVFRGCNDDNPVLVLISGRDRVDESKLASALGYSVQQAPAAWVKERTGYAIGGVPPLGHREKLVTLIDDGVFANETVWVAAGTPRSVVAVNSAALSQATHAQPARLAH